MPVATCLHSRLRRDGFQNIFEMRKTCWGVVKKKRRKEEDWGSEGERGAHL